MATKRHTVVITLSERCNLNCVYCYEKGKDVGLMPFEKAKDIIRKSFVETADGDDILFEFHGGEIALAFDRLREICEWMWSREWRNAYSCFAITNGTLIHGETARWFKSNRERFQLGLSLDGTPEMHNRNRSNSYGLIDFGFFLENWPRQPVKMTFSPESIPSVAAGLRHVHGLGFEVRCNLAYGCDWPESLLDTYSEQLDEMVEWYLMNPEVLPASLFCQKFERIGEMAVAGRRPTKWCSCGDGSECYSPSGVCYPCQVFMPSTFGRDVSQELAQQDFHGIENFHDSMCDGCVLEPSCATCPAHNYLASGSLARRPVDLCAYRKVELLHAATLMGKMLAWSDRYRYMREMETQKRPFVAKGILETLKFLEGGRMGHGT